MLPSKDERRRCLAGVPLFAELGEDELDRIAAQAVPVGLEKGATLFRAGDLPRGFYVVMQGRIKVSFLSARGAERVVEVFEAGRSFGEAVAFLAKPCPVGAQAVAKSVVLQIPVEPVLQEILRDGHYAARVIAGLCQRIHMLVMDLETHMMRSGTQRVAAYLLDQGARGQRADDAADAAPAPGRSALGRLGLSGAPHELQAPHEPPQLRLAAAKGLIASQLNLTQEHFSRILGELSRQGVIEVRGRGIRLLDARRLREYLS